jgi:hypothetical protein
MTRHRVRIELPRHQAILILHLVTGVLRALGLYGRRPRDLVACVFQHRTIWLAALSNLITILLLAVLLRLAFTRVLDLELAVVLKDRLVVV